MLAHDREMKALRIQQHLGSIDKHLALQDIVKIQPFIEKLDSPDCRYTHVKWADALVEKGVLVINDADLDNATRPTKSPRVRELTKAFRRAREVAASDPKVAMDRQLLVAEAKRNGVDHLLHALNSARFYHKNFATIRDLIKIGVVSLQIPKGPA